jgi:Cu(I)/Ag(I) efflux system periplasmic protein CusF
MRRIALVAACLLALSTSGPAVAQSAMADGEVTKIDAAQGKITLRHGPIKNLDMDSMSMVFRVKDPALLKQVKVGDKIKFEADRVDGQITVTKIEKKK